MILSVIMQITRDDNLFDGSSMEVGHGGVERNIERARA